MILREYQTRTVTSLFDWWTKHQEVTDIPLLVLPTAAGKSVILDDRAKVSPGVKFGDAELIGVPQIVIVGKGLETGEVDLWNRRTGERRSVKVESALAELG